jgi:catechol 2,3-dioxygenase-like lactoylglutathione lyase family enzyme
MIASLDHLVLTTARLDDCIRFYTEVLGMKVETFGTGRIALKFGHQKINLHQSGKEFEPKARIPTPGALDLCFIADEPLDELIRHLEQHQIKIELGPVPRTGAEFSLRSIYIRDPDLNLIEISERAE